MVTAFMTIDDGLSKILKIGLISIITLSVIGVVCYFTFSAENFFGIIISAVASFIAFIATLFSYYMIYRSKSPKKIKYVLLVYIGKIVFLGLVFYLMVNLDFINLMAFVLSFLVFFIVFFNIEIFLIYKKILFKDN